MVAIKFKFLFLLICSITIYLPVAEAADKGLERYLNTVSLLFDYFPSDGHTLESSSLSAGITLQAIPQIESKLEGVVDSSKTPPVLGVPVVSYANRSSLGDFSEGMSVGGKAYVAGLYIDSDSFMGVDKLYYISRIYGFAFDFALARGDHTFSFPFSLQHSSSETRGELVMDDVDSRAIFESDISSLGFAYAYQEKFDAALRLFKRDSNALMFPFSRDNSVEVKSSQDPTRFRDLYQLSAGFNVSTSLRLSASELIVPGVIAVPSLNVKQTYYF